MWFLSSAEEAFAQDSGIRQAQTAAAASDAGAPLSVRPRADWRGGLWGVPEPEVYAGGGLTEEDTTGIADIELKNSFWTGTKFVYGESEPQRVFTVLGLTSGFKQTIGLHPEALRVAQQAGTYQTVAFAASIASAVGAGLYRFNRDRVAITEQGVEDTSNDGGLGLMIGGAVVSVIGGVMARSRVKEGVRLFNEQQAAGEPFVQDEEPGAAGVGIAGRGVGPLEGFPQEESVQGPPAGLESWYTYWGLGWVNPGYPGELDPTIDALRDTPEVNNLALDMDLLGFYFPVGGYKTIVGGIINGAAERFEVEGESFQINQYLYSASVMHFVDQHVGRGFFVRGDAGLARIVVDSSFDGLSASESGFGFLLGGGYAFPVTRGTRLLLNANYARRSVEGESYGTFSLGVGGLF